MIGTFVIIATGASLTAVAVKIHNKITDKIFNNRNQKN